MRTSARSRRILFALLALVGLLARPDGTDRGWRVRTGVLLALAFLGRTDAIILIGCLATRSLKLVPSG